MLPQSTWLPGYLEGFYYRPRIDKEVLARYSKGLLGLSSCLKGEIPVLLQQDRFNDALKAADDYSHILEKGNFYLELQENLIPEQTKVNKGLIKISKELNLPFLTSPSQQFSDPILSPVRMMQPLEKLLIKW